VGGSGDEVVKARVKLHATVDRDHAAGRRIVVETIETIEADDAETIAVEALTSFAAFLNGPGVRSYALFVELADPVGYALDRDASSSEPSSQDAAGSPAASASSGPNT
jgi:hypothetical protein